jgi:hypothetical protein
MYPGRWVVVLWTVLGLSLLYTGLPGTGRAPAQEADNVHFLWAFEALVAEGNVTKQVPIREDIRLKTGDQLKMFVELRKPCFVYVIYHGAQGEVQLLFPYNTQQFTADYQPAKLYEIPPADGWFRLNEQAGSETFYLVASAQRLLDLEKLVDTYTVAKPAEQPQVATTIVAELRNLIRQHRASAPPGRPVPIAGNMRQVGKGVEGLEITAPTFYSKTFTIEHH